jgi:hypothetical protein
MADALKWFRDAVWGAKVQNEREELLDELFDNNLAHAENYNERQRIEQRTREIRKRLHELSGAERRTPRPVVDQFAERNPGVAEMLRNTERPHIAEVRPIRAKESA